MGRQETPEIGWVERGARLSVQAALVAPLLYVPNLAFGWTLPGAVWARVTVAAAAVAVAGLVACGRVEIRAASDPVAWGLGVVVAAAVIGTLFGASPQHSLFGNFARRGGLVGGIHLVLWYLLARSVLDGAGWRQALRVLVGVAAAAGIAAVGQRFQLGGAGPEARAFAPLGNPGQLGIFMVVGACASAASAADAEAGTGWKRFALGAGAACLAGLVASGTRAALLGLAVGVLAGGAVWTLRFPGADKLRKLGAVAAGLVVFGAVMVGLRAADGDSGIPGPEEMARQLSELEEDPTLQRRIIAWEAAGEAVKGRPLAGWGPENFRIAFDRYGDPGRPYTLDRSISYDRTHNVFAEAAVSAGIPGLLAGGGLAVALLLVVVRLAREEDAGTPLEVGAVTAGIVGYGTFLLFWYQDTSVTLAFLTLVGLAVHRTGKGRWLFPAKGTEGSGAAWKGVTSAMAILAVGVAVHALQLIPPAQALKEARSTTDAARKFRAFDRAVEARVPGAEEAVTGYAAALGGLAARARRLARQRGARAVLGPAFRAARTALARQIEVDPQNARLRSLRGQLLLAEARFRDDRVLAERAAESLAEAVERAPAQLFYRYTLAEVLRLLGEHDGSVDVLTEALAAAPQIHETRLHLSRAHLAAGRPGEAADHLVAGRAAADGAADTLLMRRLLTELPGGDARVLEIRELLARTRSALQDGSEGRR